VSAERPKIGELLVKQGTISQEAVDHALLLQRATSTQPWPLASQLIAAGLISDTDALRALSEQFGVPGIDLMQVAILSAHLEHVPHEIATSRKLLPVLAREDRLFLAMCNPKDKRAIDELEFVTGRKIFPYVAVRATLERITNAAYAARDRGETYYLAPNVPEQTLVQLGLKTLVKENLTPLMPVPATAASMGSRSMPAVDPRGANATVKAPPRNLATPLDENARETVRPQQVTALGEGYAQVLDKVARDADAQNDPVTADAADLDNPVAPDGSLGPGAVLTSPSMAAAPEGTGKLVLVVDDEDGIRKLLRRMLKSMGHRVLEARSGRDALVLLRQHTPELVLMDAMLPELHGFDVAKRMRASRRYRDVPIIMMSGVYKGWRIVEDLRENYGVHDYVEKPFNLSEMTELLARHLTRSGATAAGDAATRDPDTMNAEAEALLVIGVEAYKAGDMERAIGALRKGIELDPESYRLRYQLALLYGKRGQVYDGIRELEHAAELAPKHFPALKNLAILYEKAGFKNKAVEMWERCVHVAPDEETQRSIKEHLLKLL
jgi:DNA-binding response OmpR family regulator